MFACAVVALGVRGSTLRLRVWAFRRFAAVVVILVLVGLTEVIMLDEPVNGLDPEGILWIRRTASKQRSESVPTMILPEFA